MASLDDYCYPAESSSYHNSDLWNAIAVSAIGTRHIQTNTPCQDYSIIELCDPNVLISIVSDGAGSAPRSLFGARIATEAALHATKLEFTSHWPTDQTRAEEYFRRILEQVHDNLKNVAEEYCCPLSDFHCTLIVTVANSDSLCTCQIGDGFIVYGRSDDCLKLIPTPPKGEYANETSFITEVSSFDAAKISFVPEPISSLAISSDGLERLALDLCQNTPYERFFSPLFEFVRSISIEVRDSAQSDLSELLHSDGINQRTDDDKTLVIACRRSIT